MPVSILRRVILHTTYVDRPPLFDRSSLFFYLAIHLFSRWPLVIVFTDAGAYLRSENVTYAILTERRVNIHRSATPDRREEVGCEDADMNIEDRDARRRGRTVDNRLPLTGVRGRRLTGWRSGRVAVAMAVVPANTPVMTGQTEICITLGEARLAFPSASPRRERPSVSVKPPNFLGLGSYQEFPVVIELSVSSVQDSTCWLAKLCKAACRTPRSSLSALLPIDRRLTCIDAPKGVCISDNY